jgi:DNA-directed RNA polymerase subunit RPC12/RpoP
MNKIELASTVRRRAEYRPENILMSAGKIIAYIVAAILIFFGVLFIWATFSPDGNIGWLLIGVISVVIGLALIWLARKQQPSAEAGDVTLKIDLPADVQLDKFQCTNCGGDLTMDNVKMVAGAPTVNCPYCGTTYQLKEQPKW